MEQNNAGVAAYEKGDYAQAITLLERARRQYPDDANIRRNLVVAYNAQAMAEMRADNILSGRQLFLSALAVAPRDPDTRRNYFTALNNQAVRLIDKESYKEAEAIFRELEKQSSEISDEPLLRRYRENHAALLTVWGRREMADGNDENARILLHRAVLAAPQNPAALREYANYLYANDLFDEAERHYRLANRYDPDDREYYQARVRVCQGDRQFERRALHYSPQGGRFIVSYSQSIQGGKVRELLGDLDEAHGKLKVQLGFTPKRAVRVKIYSTEDFYSIHGVPLWAGGFFDGKLRVPAKLLESGEKIMRQTAFHEMTHVFLHARQGDRLEFWLHEGLAQLYEPEAEITPDELRRLRWLVNGGGGSFDQIRRQSYEHIVGKDAAQTAYAHAKGLVIYLVERRGAHQMRKFLYEVYRGRQTAEAIKKVYGIELEALYQEWLRWGKRNY